MSGRIEPSNEHHPVFHLGIYRHRLAPTLRGSSSGELYEFSGNSIIQQHSLLSSSTKRAVADLLQYMFFYLELGILGSEHISHATHSLTSVSVGELDV